MLDHDHAVLHRDASDCDESDRCRNRDVQPRQRQARKAANRRKWNHRQHQRSLANRLERPEQQRKNRQQADRHDHLQALECALLVLKLTAPGEVVTRWQADLFGDAPLCFSHETALVASGQIHLYRNQASTIFAANA